MTALIDTDGAIIGLFPDPAQIPAKLSEKYRTATVELCPVCQGARYVEIRTYSLTARRNRKGGKTNA